MLIFERPTKSIPLNKFIYKYPQESDHEPMILELPHNVQVTEMIDGIKIYLFYDSIACKWEIIIENTDEFLETFIEIVENKKGSQINETKFVENLDKNNYYCFILQNSNNENPQLYLIMVYKINNNQSIFIPLSDVIENMKYFENIVKYPKIITYPKTYILLEQYLNYCERFSNFIGFVLTDIHSGERTKIVKKKYQYIREHFRNYSCIENFYLQLIKNNKIDEFIYFHPSYKNHCEMFKKNFEQFISDIHAYYYLYYVKKYDKIDYNENLLFLLSFIDSKKIKENKNITMMNIQNWIIDNFDSKQIFEYMSENITK
jgi:hypothetical protein